MGNIIISSEQLEVLVESLKPKKTNILSEAVLGAPLKVLRLIVGFLKKDV